MNVVVAHEYLWDEILIFVVPVLLVLAAVRWAERRKPDDSSPTDTTGIVADEIEPPAQTRDNR